MTPSIPDVVKALKPGKRFTVGQNRGLATVGPVELRSIAGA